MSHYYLAFDSETGGLNPKTSDMLTLYMAILDEDFKVMEELDLKLKPEGRLPIAEEQALKVNKIDLHKHISDVGTITYSEGKTKIVSLIKKYLKKSGRYSNIRPLGQNVQFDIDYVQEYILPKDEWNSMIHYGKIDTKTICDFLKDAGWFPKTLGSLTSIVEYLGVPAREAHSAKEDTLMCVEVYKKYLELMNNKKENSSQQDLISLLEAE
jgi:DNA polymerase III epsilon subunit-like protein